jgi:glycosyltransferase involved in cell wall biosynthesis
MISVYVRNKDLCPASYYRITQYLNQYPDVIFHNIASDAMFTRNQYVDRQGVKYKIWQLRYFVHMMLRGAWYTVLDLHAKPETVIVSRSIYPHKSPRLGIELLRHVMGHAEIVIWDFDDDIFLNGEITDREAALLEEKSDRIVVTHDYLKSRLPDVYQKKVICMPTTDGDFQRFVSVDKERMIKNRLETLQREIRLVWVGQAVGLRYFKPILKELDRFAQIQRAKFGRSTILSIVCNKDLMADCRFLKIKNIRWSKNAALQCMQESQIGIMPLEDKPYSKGKGGFKLVQYLSAGLPVIGSNVGYNKQVVNEKVGYLAKDTEWCDKLLLLSDANVWKVKAINSFEYWKQNFSYDFNAKIWEKLLQKI